MPRFLFVVICLISTEALGDQNTIGPNGIDSKDTHLDGSGVQVGMAEGGRSGKFDYDLPANSASNLFPTGVYFQNAGGMDAPNSANIADHSTYVAGVMIAKSEPVAFYEGVAPNAELHSLRVSGIFDDSNNALALNRLALLNGGAIKAINLSYYRPLQDIIEAPDGRSHFAQFIDWSARRHDVLYVAAWGNVENEDFRTPSDDYNGITVAGSERAEDSKWRRFWSGNAQQGDAFGGRTSIDLLAPGVDVNVVGRGNQTAEVMGSSFATAHTTGAVALLQQYAQQQIDASNPRFGLSQHHEVMKAVLLNSADKIEGVHGSDRTICDSPGTGDCHDWTESAAFSNVSIPLDDTMGAGHLNVRRAVQQFAPGDHDSIATVPMIAWDYDFIGPNQSKEYMLSQPVAANEYIAITLAWDRIVNHTGGNTYSAGDQFFPYEDADDILNDLDIRLETADGLSVVAASQSIEMNLEHIFFRFQTAGQYRIVVEHTGGLGTSQNYALAWWYGVPATQPGDYNGNGSVGPEDYDVWRSGFGSTVTVGTGADGNGIIDAADYVVWRNAMAIGSGNLATVPEPSAAILVIVGILSRLLGTRAKFALA